MMAIPWCDRKVQTGTNQIQNHRRNDEWILSMIGRKEFKAIAN